MNQLITYIESLDPTFTHLQIANGYDWQNATIIKRSSLQNGIAQPIDIAIGASIAVEFFFTFAKDHEFFIGFKYIPGQLKNLSAPEFVEELYKLAAKTKGPRQLLQSAGEQLLSDPNIYLDRAVDRAVELVVNYWDEVGTAIIWKSGEKPLDRTSLQRKLSANHELTETRKNPIVLEIDYGAPAMWVGIDVSRKIGPNYTLQSDIVLALLQIAQQSS